MLKNKVESVDEIDPEFASLIARVVHKDIPALILGDKVYDISVKPAKEIVIIIGRNDPCPFCLEDKKQIKWKKCQIHNKNT